MKITKGLDVPISGVPLQEIEQSNKPSKVALLGQDYPGLRPTIQVAVGDQVKIGQTLFVDRKNLGVCYTSPAAGEVLAINRGAKRAFESIEIQLADEEESLQIVEPQDPSAIEDAAVIRDALQRSGMWTTLRSRPYAKVPQTDSQPKAIFINAMDTRPLAADPSAIIALDEEAFQQGVRLLSRLTDQTFVCHESSYEPPKIDAKGVSYHGFSGVHPAGLPGTHMHFLCPASETNEVWSIHYQDVIAIAHLFAKGHLYIERVIALAGPRVIRPRLLQTRVGVDLLELLDGKIEDDGARIISGSVLCGFHVHDHMAYLGRNHLQVSVIANDQERDFLHWVQPWMKNKFSILNVFFRRVDAGKKLAFSGTQSGSHRAMVPLGTYEQVMPLDVLATQLLRALLIRDTEEAQKLGALELDEEDLSLCTFVCHSKYDYAPALRECLNLLERGE